MAAAERLGSTSFDMPGAAYRHDGDQCSFDAFMSRHGLGNNPGLALLARIVRAADTARLDLQPQASGLLALSLGLAEKFQNDDQMLTAAMPLYDALYAWCNRSIGALDRVTP